MVNAVYHRSYEQREPIEVRISPDSIEIISYPGPDASIRVEALNSERVVARRYRNRRIGDFLKELRLTEGRCTGIPTIRRALAENGSPPARFSTDESRTYFIVEIAIHPEVTAEVTAEEGVVHALLKGDMSGKELREALGLKHDEHFRKSYLLPALEERLIEMTMPDKPRVVNSDIN